MNPVRSVLAVLGGIVLWSFLDQLLEATLVRAVAGAPLASLADYLAVRNRPPLLAAKVAYDTFAGLLAGYVAAKVAGSSELLHGLAAAAVLTLILANGFFLGADGPLTPLAARLIVLAVVAPAVVAGAVIRGRAAQALASAPPEAPPEAPAEGKGSPS